MLSFLWHSGRRCPSIADRQILPYNEACLYETMRAGVIAGLGLPHSTICDTQVGMSAKCGSRILHLSLSLSLSYVY